MTLLYVVQLFHFYSIQIGLIGNAILYIRSNINRGPISILTIFQCPTQMMCVECTIVL